MALFTEQELQQRYREEYGQRQLFESVESLTKSFRVFDSQQEYDIFLSHSSEDKPIVYGLALKLQDLGFRVYVDWRDDYLDPNNVTPNTAKVLRERMQQCSCLIYAFSESATHSHWMPWELGYFDGLKNGKVAVLPITKQQFKTGFSGNEFVGLYYHVQIDKIQDTNKLALWIHDGAKYVIADSWIRGGKLPYLHNL